MPVYSEQLKTWTAVDPDLRLIESVLASSYHFFLGLYHATYCRMNFRTAFLYTGGLHLVNLVNRAEGGHS